jgi:hypothetical protein
MDVIKGSPPWGSRIGPSAQSPYQDLALTVVKVAAKDYQKTLKAMWKSPESPQRRAKLLQEKLELEAFFYSEDFQLYCDIPPDRMITLCRRKAVEDARKAKKSQKKRSRIVAAGEDEEKEEDNYKTE